ncbi:MAG: hypothetical protein Q4G38_04945 [Aeriscardovia aeriphila]|nr:hypothetical protein [Aeriscardovia aeriphila]
MVLLMADQLKKNARKAAQAAKSASSTTGADSHHSVKPGEAKAQENLPAGRVDASVPGFVRTVMPFLRPASPASSVPEMWLSLCLIVLFSDFSMPANPTRDGNITMMSIIILILFIWMIKRNLTWRKQQPWRVFVALPVMMGFAGLLLWMNTDAMRIVVAVLAAFYALIIFLLGRKFQHKR